MDPGTLIALAALLLSVTALYLSVKRAEIRLVTIPGSTTRLGAGSWGLTEIGNIRSELKILAYNSGARGGVLTHVEIATLEEPTGFLTSPTLSWSGNRPPIGIDAAGTTSLTLQIVMNHSHRFATYKEQLPEPQYRALRRENYSLLLERFKKLGDLPVTLITRTLPVERLFLGKTRLRQRWAVAI